MTPFRHGSRLALGTGVDVRCHPACPWMDGFEIVGVEMQGLVPHYRVRRRGHPRALPASLPADQVQPAHAVDRVPVLTAPGGAPARTA